MINELRSLEQSRDKRAWLSVAALYPRLRPEARGAFVKALRRLDAPKQAFTTLRDGASEGDTLAALTVLRVMKPKESPVHLGLDHPSAIVRRQAALAACAVPMHATLKASLLGALDDSDALVRDFAVNALARVADVDVKSAMRARLAIETNVVVRDDLAHQLR